jgi:hypothetical protein
VARGTAGRSHPPPDPLTPGKDSHPRKADSARKGSDASRSGWVAYGRSPRSARWRLGCSWAARRWRRATSRGRCCIRTPQGDVATIVWALRAAARRDRGNRRRGARRGWVPPARHAAQSARRSVSDRGERRGRRCDFAIAVTLGVAIARSCRRSASSRGSGRRLLVAALARRGSGIDVERLILAGVSLSALFSSFVALALTRLSQGGAEEILAWLAGSLAGRGWNEVLGRRRISSRGWRASATQRCRRSTCCGSGRTSRARSGLDLARSAVDAARCGDAPDGGCRVAFRDRRVRRADRAASRAAPVRNGCANSAAGERALGMALVAVADAAEPLARSRRKRFRSACCSRSSACRVFCTCICVRAERRGCGARDAARRAHRGCGARAARGVRLWISCRENSSRSSVPNGVGKTTLLASGRGIRAARGGHVVARRRWSLGRSRRTGARNSWPRSGRMPKRRTG